MDLSKKPRRTCRTMHECCICHENIQYGYEYYDGGYGNRAHVSCVTPQKEKPVRMTKDEWLDKGKQFFGSDMMQWEFVCPSCGHVQKPEDFRPYEDKGATPNSATVECIGRYDGHMDIDMCSGKSPCNYASYGLFNFNPVTVIDEDGSKHRCFAFKE